MLDYLDHLPKQLRPFLQKKEFCRGEPILHSGEENQNIYLVTKGDAIGYVEGWNGSLIFVERYGPGDLFGELEVFCEGLRTIGITAQTACTVYLLHKQYLLAWMEQDFSFTQALIRHLAEAMHRYADNVTQLQLMTVEERVKKCILTYEAMGMLDKLDKKALMAGSMASLRSVNRAVSRLEEEGAVRVREKRSPSWTGPCWRAAGREGERFSGRMAPADRRGPEAARAGPGLTLPDGRQPQLTHGQRGLILITIVFYHRSRE